MPLEIPLFSDPFFTEQVLLDGRAYNFHFRYNTACERYYLHISDDQDVPLFDGVKLMCGKILNRFSADERNPTGVLMCQAQGSDDSPPKLGELGQRVLLFYFTLDELNAAEP